jgi:hypothetical protein
LVLGADAVELVIEDAVPTANQRAFIELVDRADSRSEVVFVGPDERALG